MASKGTESAGELGESAAAAQSLVAAHAARAFAEGLSRAFHVDSGLRMTVSHALQASTLQQALATTEGELAALLSPGQAIAVIRERSGLQSWLVAPEDGIRVLISKSLELSQPPLLDALGTVHDAMQAWAKAFPLQLPPEQEELLRELRETAEDALKEWKADTETGLRSLLEAEKRVSPGAFEALRHTVSHLVVPAAEGPATKAGVPVASAASAGVLNRFYMGWCDKLSRAGLWQRRWCVLSLDGGTLRYYARPDAAEKPRAVLALAGATISPEGEKSFSIKPQISREPMREVLMLRADSMAVREQWLLMFGACRALAGKPVVAALGRQDEEEEGPVHGTAAERKISTHVYSAPEGSALPAAAQQWEHGQDDDGKGAALLADIERSAQERSVTPLESAQLSLLLPACRAYITDARGRLADLGAKLIAASMLNPLRSDDLYEKLLNVLH